MTGRPEVAVGAVSTDASVESLADRWFRFRNRILSSPRFQRWAARFPLFRWIARRRTLALFDLCAGFVYSQVLQAAVGVGLFEALASGPQTVPELAPRLSLSPESAQRLLDAAASLELAQRRSGGRYGLGVHGASLVGNPAVALMVEHHALVYRDLADPVSLLRGERRETELGQFWTYASRGGLTPSDELVARYSTLMAGSLGLIAEDILEAYPLGRHRTLLDVGGGEGAFLQAAGARFPGLSLMLFDLPPVAARARARIGQAGRDRQAAVIGGDVFRDPLPQGADVISLVRIVHDHDDAQALRIQRAVRQALAPGGVLLLAEPMAGTAGAERMGDAYFGFYLLAMGQGRPRTAAELASLCRPAGFSSTELPRTRRPMLTRLLIAHAP